MFSCVLVDIVPISVEQPIEVDQEQLFGKEESLLGKQGKWSSPLACSIFVLL